MIRRVRVQRAATDNAGSKWIKVLINNCYTEISNTLSVMVRQFKVTEQVTEGLKIKTLDISIIGTEDLRRIMRMAYRNANEEENKWLHEMVQDANKATYNSKNGLTISKTNPT